MWVVRKYVAYLVFYEEDEENSFTFAYEPMSNKVMPAVFESHLACRYPYRAAVRHAKTLNDEMKKGDTSLTPSKQGVKKGRRYGKNKTVSILWT